MTDKQLEAIATVFKWGMEGGFDCCSDTFEEAAYRMADGLVDSDDSIDRDHFLRLCGIEYRAPFQWVRCADCRDCIGIFYSVPIVPNPWVSRWRREY
jgi:hypothetical protein